MPGSLFTAVRVSEPGASNRRLPGDGDSPCWLPTLHRVCREPPQNSGTLPPLPAARTAGAAGEERAAAAPRCLPKDARCSERSFSIEPVTLGRTPAGFTHSGAGWRGATTKSGPRSRRPSAESPSRRGSGRFTLGEPGGKEHAMPSDSGSRRPKASYWSLGCFSWKLSIRHTGEPLRGRRAAPAASSQRGGLRSEHFSFRRGGARILGISGLPVALLGGMAVLRSEEHTSELQSLR